MLCKCRWSCGLVAIIVETFVSFQFIVISEAPQLKVVKPLYILCIAVYDPFRDRSGGEC